jgi:hypothetical protein
VSLRALAALALALAAAVTAVWWLGKAPEDDGGKTPAEAPLLPLAPKDVVAIEITRAGHTLGLERRPQVGWVLTRPALEEARAAAAEAVVAGLVTARVRRVLEPSLPAAARAEFGLDPPEAEATVRAAGDGVAPVTIRLGGTSPVSADRYVQDGAGRLLLVEAGLGGSFDTSRESLAERRLLAAEPSEVQAIRVSREGDTVLLERDPAGWAMKEPLADRADAREADAWVRLLTGLTVARPLRDPGEEARAGAMLGKPVAQVTVTLTGHRLAPVIALAAEGPLGTADDPERYASRPSRLPGARPVAGPVPATALDDLLRSAEGLRDPDLVGLDLPQLVEARIRARGRELVLRRAGEAPGTPWTAREDGKDATAPDAARVAGWLDRVRALRAAGFAPAGTALAPERTVVLTPREGPPVTVDLGAPVGDRVPLRSSLRPGVVAWVQAEAVPPWPTRVAELPAVEAP